METAEEYWAMAENRSKVLRKLVADWHPMRRTETDSIGEISAERSEEACKMIRKELVKLSKPGRRVLDEFDESLAKRDGEIFSNVLSETWFGLPESQSVRRLPGFFDLCELCDNNELVFNTEE